MGSNMTRDASSVDQLLRRVEQGDAHVKAEIFALYRGRLKQMVRLRLNRRLQSRIDDSDIVQEAYLEATQRLPKHLATRPLPFYSPAGLGRRPR